MQIKRKKHLEELVRLRVGTYRRANSGLYLDRNERVIPHDKKTLGLLNKYMSDARLHLYPDLDVFYNKLAGWLGVNESEIYVTEGVSGAIKSIVETIASPGDNIIFPTPTFALYPVYSRMFNVEYRTVGYKEDYQLDIEKLYTLIDANTSIVFLPNPNVPIEGTLSIDSVSLLAKHCLANNAFLAVDEVYYPFGGPTCIDLIKQFDNILIMRSMSKAFGLAGIRMGYMLGNSRNIDYVSKTRTGYESNAASISIASFFIDNYFLIENYIKEVQEGISYLKGELNNLGLESSGGVASNFVYINMRDKKHAEQVIAGLKAKKIYVRGVWPKPYEAGIAVTCAPKAVMREFVDALKNSIK